MKKSKAKIVLKPKPSDISLERLIERDHVIERVKTGMELISGKTQFVRK